MYQSNPTNPMFDVDFINFSSLDLSLIKSSNNTNFIYRLTLLLCKKPLFFKALHSAESKLWIIVTQDFQTIHRLALLLCKNLSFFKAFHSV